MGKGRKKGREAVGQGSIGAGRKRGREAEGARVRQVQHVGIRP